MIMISLNTIRRNLPCTSGWRALLAGQAKSYADDELFPVSAILDSNNFLDTVWTLRCLPEHDNLWRKYAVWLTRLYLGESINPKYEYMLDLAWRHSEGRIPDRVLAQANAKCTPILLEYVSRSSAWSAVSAACYYVHCDELEVELEAKLRQILILGYWTEESP
jgi:hypothetical protein